MAASQIPNLLSLRGRGGARGPGRARGRGGISTDSPSAEQETAEQARARADRVIQLTDQDANLSRLSAVNAGYLQDPFAHIFTPSSSESARRMPIINRGTYARTTAIDQLVKSFLTATPIKKQIVSLGAGTDTRYFRLANEGLMENLVYHEIDFPVNTEAKLAYMKQHSSIVLSLLGASSMGSHELHNDHYHLHPEDLRKLAEQHYESRLLSHTDEGRASLERGIPTLIISECCLCYLTKREVDSVLQKLIEYLGGTTGLIFYEPIKPDDAFGRVMRQNLEKRGIQMPTISHYPSLKTQQDRFASYGLTDGAKAVDVDFVMRKWVSDGERERIDKCEMLDEMEEWVLLAQHYCISFGWMHSGSDGTDDVWSTWKLLPAHEG